MFFDSCILRCNIAGGGRSSNLAGQAEHLPKGPKKGFGRVAGETASVKIEENNLIRDSRTLFVTCSDRMCSEKTTFIRFVPACTYSFDGET